MQEVTPAFNEEVSNGTVTRVTANVKRLEGASSKLTSLTEYASTELSSEASSERVPVYVYIKMVEYVI